MIRVKDICRWYNMSYRTARERLIECGVVSAQDTGKGNRKSYPATQLKPFFAVYGTPRELTLMLEF